MRRTVSAVLRWLASATLLTASLLPATGAYADNSLTIERVKASVVAIGTFERTRTPQFQFLGTGFAVGDGTLIATNAHVLPKVLDAAHQEILAILVPGQTRDSGDQAQGREAKQMAVDAESDLALIKVKADKNSRNEVFQIVDIFRARIVDVAADSLIIEMTGGEDKIEALEALLKPFGIKEMVRTGIIAMARGVKTR